MNSTIALWSMLALCAAVIGLSGARLSHYGDLLAQRTGWSGSWVGIVLLASVTSLPELATGAVSVTIAHAPDIAVGNALGACVFNLVMIVALDSLYRSESLYVRASVSHVLAASLAIVMLGAVASSLVLAANGVSFSIGHVGASFFVIVIGYMLSLRTLLQYERQHADVREAVLADESDRTQLSTRSLALRYALAAAIVAGAAIALPFVARELAVVMDWQQEFVGTFLVAIATTLPELVVTIAALRLGAVDMAIGNLLGSVLFNVLVLAIDDLLFTAGPLLASVSSLHALSAVSAMMMSAAAIAGLLYRPSGRLMRTVSWVSLLLFAMYVFNSLVLYLHGN